MIAIVIGTRPEIIKMAPVFRRLKEKGRDFVFLHTNQHYSKEMDADIISDLKLDEPHHNFKIGSLPHAAQTGRAMEGLENYFTDHRPDFVLVHGDTNSTLAGAMAAKKMGIPIGHVEAGLRSFDQKMPEEINRILVDRISDLHFAPTEIAKQNLIKEGFEPDEIDVYGNTVADALIEHSVFADASNILERLGVRDQQFILATMHRPENVDSKETLQKTIDLITFASEKLGHEVLLPLHPRTAKNIKNFGLLLPTNFKVINPVGYIDMLALLKGSALVMTDSGGLQEEAFILKRPLVTMRDSTERPETLSANFLVHHSIDELEKALDAFRRGEYSHVDCFGTGDASAKIVDRMLRFLD
jgi:UDP-N-acetylglucosamine 2-epimerase (non-hydrolysing)